MDSIIFPALIYIFIILNLILVYLFYKLLTKYDDFKEQMYTYIKEVGTERQTVLNRLDTSEAMIRKLTGVINKEIRKNKRQHVHEE